MGQVILYEICPDVRPTATIRAGSASEDRALLAQFHAEHEHWWLERPEAMTYISEHVGVCGIMWRKTVDGTITKMDGHEVVSLMPGYEVTAPEAIATAPESMPSPDWNAGAVAPLGTILRHQQGVQTRPCPACGRKQHLRDWMTPPSWSHAMLEAEIKCPAVKIVHVYGQRLVKVSEACSPTTCVVEKAR